jgi:hypothetical protein
MVDEQPVKATVATTAAAIGVISFLKLNAMKYPSFAGITQTGSTVEDWTSSSQLGSPGSRVRKSYDVLTSQW